MSNDLHGAAYLGNCEEVRAFLKKGANVNAQGTDNWTPLHMAANKNQVEAAALLIAGGPTSGHKTLTGGPPSTLQGALR